MILLVDDCQDAADVLARLLRKLGYPAEALSSGGQALQYLRAHPTGRPTLVVLDEMMPQLTGLETLREIRADPDLADTAVMFLTAGFDAIKSQQAFALGALAWRYKGTSTDFPVILNEVIRIYRNVGGAKQTDT